MQTSDGAHGLFEGVSVICHEIAHQWCAARPPCGSCVAHRVLECASAEHVCRLRRRACCCCQWECSGYACATWHGSQPSDHGAPPAACRFGNLITKQDWTLVSVDEGIASFLEYKCMNYLASGRPAWGAGWDELGAGGISWPPCRPEQSQAVPLQLAAYARRVLALWRLVPLLHGASVSSHRPEPLCWLDLRPAPTPTPYSPHTPPGLPLQGSTLAAQNISTADGASLQSLGVSLLKNTVNATFFRYVVAPSCLRCPFLLYVAPRWSGNASLSAWLSWRLCTHSVQHLSRPV